MYLLDLISSVLNETLILFKIQTIIIRQGNLGLKLDLFQTKSEEISDVLFWFENTSNSKDFRCSRSYFISNFSILSLICSLQ